MAGKHAILRGDFEKLTKLTRAVAELAGGGEFIHRTSNRLATIAESLAEMGARVGVAPSGHKWAPLKEKGGGRALAKMAGSFGVARGKAGFRIASSLARALLHAKGGRSKTTKWTLPQRRALPKSVLPKKWYVPMMEAMRAEFRAHFKR